MEDSFQSIGCYVDSEEEVFFGPMTDSEREIRSRLPRRTLHVRYHFNCLDLK